jgi:hypothetical protein
MKTIRFLKERSLMEEKILVCPNCGAYDVGKIIYGNHNQAAMDAAARKEIFLGGCCIYKEAPTHTCRICSHSWRHESI